LKLKQLEKLKNFLNKVAHISGTRAFGIFVLIFYGVESVWIAFSAQYPQAFDENYHFGLIKVYSHYWLPFFAQQPPNANAFGAVAADTSYFYHYLMSFPYRFIVLFIHNQPGQVISLRLIDVVLMGVALVLFRKVLIRVGISRSLANISLLLFILIPIVPQLAAQVSYDDLFIPMTAWACLKCFDVIDDLRAQKPSAKRLLTFLIVCFFASIVKFAFLPIFVAMVLFLIYFIYKNYKDKLSELARLYWKDYLKLKRPTKYLLCGLLIISVGLVFQRDGLDLIKYHSVEPDCSKVLSVKQCSTYSPWDYNYINHNNVASGKYVANDSVLLYTNNWLYRMWYRLFFAVNGITQTTSFANYPPLPLPAIAAAVVGLFGVAALIKTRKRVFSGNPYIVVLLMISLIYCLTLFAQGYSTYKYTSILENMNGRYLLPILLPVAAVIGLAISKLLGGAKWSKAALSLVVVLMFLEGGGVISFIVRSDSNWYWDNSTVIKLNKTAHKIVKHVVVTKPSISQRQT
jgi:hypothetical protein